MFLACLLGLYPAWLQAGSTARKALELLVQSVPREVSSQIVAIVGFDGASEPETWSFLVRSPSAPEVIHEYRVREGQLSGPRKLLAEETPEGLDRPLPAGPMPVDSHDVARIIDDAVILEGVHFDRIDYQLCWRGKGPEPLWMATLVGGRGETLGHMFVSSTSGEVTHRAFYHDFPRLAVPVGTQGANRKAAAEASSSETGAMATSEESPSVSAIIPGGSSNRPMGSLFRKRGIFQKTSPRIPVHGEEGEGETGRASRESPPFLRRR